MSKDEAISTFRALKLALEALELNRRTHYYCEDTWYSCPKHEDGCANEAEGDECNCGADQINAQIDNAITALREALAEQQAQQALDKMAKNARELGLDYEPVKQEPVATVTSESGADVTMSWWHEPALPTGTKLYTSPPAQQEPVAKDNSNYRLDPPGLDQLYTSPPAQQEPIDQLIHAWQAIEETSGHVLMKVTLRGECT